MFPGMSRQKPKKEEALKQLKTNLAFFGYWFAVVRIAPYILHFFSDQKQELKLDF